MYIFYTDHKYAQPIDQNYNILWKITQIKTMQINVIVKFRQETMYSNIESIETSTRKL